jgi:ATP adenylyltransferase
MRYIAGKKEKKCIFCEAAKGAESERVIFRSKFTLAMLNLYPYNNGHLLIVPLRHIADLSDMKEKELLDLMRCLLKGKKLLQSVLKPDGFNAGINMARAGGAGITDHLHMHLVPRWIGDSNFMPVISDTKIISQSLQDLSGLLKKEIKKTK